jgi:hypothetical protein
MASRTGASSKRSRDLFRNREHLSAPAPFSRQSATGRIAPWFAESCCGFRLAIGSVGGFFQSLSFRWPLARERRNGEKSVADVRASAREDRQMDQQARQDSPRQVWHNYRETRLTYEKSYLARLNYTHQNAVKHGLVPVANQYPWSSARWFERTAAPAQIKTIYRFKIDRLKMPDEFGSSPDW